MNKLRREKGEPVDYSEGFTGGINSHGDYTLRCKNKSRLIEPIRPFIPN